MVLDSGDPGDVPRILEHPGNGSRITSDSGMGPGFQGNLGMVSDSEALGNGSHDSTGRGNGSRIPQQVNKGVNWFPAKLTYCVVLVVGQLLLHNHCPDVVGSGLGELVAEQHD